MKEIFHAKDNFVPLDHTVYYPIFIGLRGRSPHNEEDHTTASTDSGLSLPTNHGAATASCRAPAQFKALRSVVQIYPYGTIIQAENLTINGHKKLTLTSSKKVDLTAGGDLGLTSGKMLSLQGGLDTTVEAPWKNKV